MDEEHARRQLEALKITAPDDNPVTIPADLFGEVATHMNFVCNSFRASMEGAFARLPVAREKDKLDPGVYAKVIEHKANTQPGAKGQRAVSKAAGKAGKKSSAQQSVSQEDGVFYITYVQYEWARRVVDQLKVAAGAGSDIPQGGATCDDGPRRQGEDDGGDDGPRASD